MRTMDRTKKSKKELWTADNEMIIERKKAVKEDFYHEVFYRHSEC